ncbi:subtilisin-like serine-protease S [Citrus sinensis]|uniref:subtilisin-like serine-protease S n=1 Tax=Citrus sinensis TaxID=2711 RepID=UPI000763ADC4|nr:subtilisin-like serine-protease S [Citrus sinensis]
MKVFKTFSLLSLLIFASSVYGHGSNNIAKHYIVYMGEHSLPNAEAVFNSNHELLFSVLGRTNEEAQSAIVHHYHKSFSGFSAMLTPQETIELKKHDSVVSVFESKTYGLATTRSWDFMQQMDTLDPNHGIFQSLRKRQRDVIVGHIDSGIWPEAPAFTDSGLGPVPKYFRGSCTKGDRFRSARDDFGHGTNTASVAVGAGVLIQNQLAIGGAPNARLSVYCKADTLIPSSVQGKIVICYADGLDDNIVAKAEVVEKAAGIGMIIIQENNATTINDLAVPTLILGQDEALSFKNYMSIARKNAVITSISPATAVIETESAPKMADFSSKRPNHVAPDIIKPDITAPGVNVYSALLPPSGVADNAVVYGYTSGTSIAAPHVAGLAGNTIDFGSGHFNPDGGMSPGLVYEFDDKDVHIFLCSQTTDQKRLRAIMGIALKCQNSPVPAYQLNLPNIAISNLDKPIRLNRTVTFKGKREGPQVFRVSVEQPEGVNVRVELNARVELNEELSPRFLGRV